MSLSARIEHGAIVLRVRIVQVKMARVTVHGSCLLSPSGGCFVDVHINGWFGTENLFIVGRAVTDHDRGGEMRR